MTEQRYGRLSRFAKQLVEVPSADTPLTVNIDIRCACGATQPVKLETLTLARTPAPFQCKPCRCNSPRFKSKISGIVKNRWSDGIYDADTADRRNSADRKTLLSEQSKQLWQSEVYRAKVIESTDYEVVSDRTKAAMVGMGPAISDRSKQLWQDPGYREGQSRRARERWCDPEYRQKMAAILANQPRVSSIQLLLYSILEDMGVPHFRERDNGVNDPECQIGPYCFDCVVPRPGRNTLLIECQGEYWHSLPNMVRRDNAKASYVVDNLSDRYELKYLWEHEFQQLNKIRSTLEYLLGVPNAATAQYDLGDLEVRQCPASDYRPLLGKYHYLPNAGRGGIAYGAYLGTVLVAVCIFSPLSRQNITTGGQSPERVRDLSRLCIHPDYRRPNLASWFVARCLALLPSQYTTIISYCDTTYNHTGGVYRACNFKHAGIVPPDYWYVDQQGWVMHKKSLYNRAVSLGMTESEYAVRHRMSKIYGHKKLKFIYHR